MTFIKTISGEWYKIQKNHSRYGKMHYLCGKI